MAITKIQIKRGAEANLPTLDTGEPAFTTDEHNFYMGTNGTNYRYVKEGGDDVTGDFYMGDMAKTRDGTITRSSGQISQITKSGGRTITISRDGNGAISSFTDGTYTWTLSRDVNGQIDGWTVT